VLKYLASGGQSESGKFAMTAVKSRAVSDIDVHVVIMAMTLVTLSKYYYAAVMIGRITDLARPSVPYGLLTRKQKRTEKPKLV